MFKLFISNFFIIFLFSCSNVAFIYDEKIKPINPIYEKTVFVFSGKDIPALYKYSSEYFGNSKANIFQLNINVEEEKTKRSIQSNQVVSKLDYELKIDFVLESINDACKIYKNTVYSRFSYVPKSSGYNFGSDESLEKMYELAARDSIEEIMNLLSTVDSFTCKNED